MDLPDWLTRTADRLAQVDGVVGVCLGGSRARGAHRPDSDWDLGLYYRGPLDTAALRVAAEELTGGPAELTEPGGWGPWVDGGGWLTVGGTQVDWLYRDLDRVARHYADCAEGHVEIGHQVGHPLGVYALSYPGELALGRVLADPTGELTEVRRRVSAYPDALRTALVAAARWEPGFVLTAAGKGAKRGDAFYAAGCVFRAVGVLAHGICGAERRWVVNEKGLVAEAAVLATAPPDLEARVQEVFALAGELPAMIGAARRLADDVTARLPDQPA
ncbi:nucleotidyltransferase domain-containing protein [Nonomuraea sp. NPDC050310]|uniref:nucleotidyltransferase domain-containing protein n=1 Tax=unclassified Nonomuraea TaxID=2593643 RepID=UPI0033DDDB92